VHVAVDLPSIKTIFPDPKILILDEATSSVDTRTEKETRKAMDNLMDAKAVPALLLLTPVYHPRS